MNVFGRFRGHVVAVIERMAEDGAIPSGLDLARVAVEPPRDANHGDMTTNAAMVLAGPAAMKPNAFASLLAERLARLDDVADASVAGPGFVNLRLEDSFWHARLAETLQSGPAYGDSSVGGGEAVNVEFVSANPTGPLHVGHSRGAVVGDALAALLEKAGYDVTREYYVNDAGAQVDKLAHAAYWRYLEALGDKVSEDVIDGFVRDSDLEYRGDYLIPVGARLAERDGVKWVEAARDEWLPEVRAFVIDEMMGLIRRDLDALGIRFDVFTSERGLVAEGKVEDALRFLEARGLIYTGVLDPPKGKKPDDWEPRPQTLFRASAFGDDVDRPLRKSDGAWTYFATDIAYHLDKARRGYQTMIDVWGADHGGYVKRMQAAVKALTDGRCALDVKLCQMVGLFENGEPVAMSKRAGAFVAAADVVERVGRDAVRFIMLTRRNDAHLDFDFAKVTERSRDNPVFYVQYAHARVRSLFRHAAEVFGSGGLDADALARAAMHRLTDADEVGLIKVLAGWPRVVEGAAEAHEPHRVAYYLHALAAQFHALWNKGTDDANLRFLVEEDPELSRARLALAQGVATVVASGLRIFGVTPVEEMR
ncbi:MAG: arginine--tRNA ligase [Rhodospirillales bacterium]|jgi:arginyl-tRNA synthetase|nr:arginine--tRNA ligase [Rhodospirillales bacterium]